MFRLLSLHPGPDIGIPAAAVLAECTVADNARLFGGAGRKLPVAPACYLASCRPWAEWVAARQAG